MFSVKFKKLVEVIHITCQEAVTGNAAQMSANQWNGAHDYTTTQIRTEYPNLIQIDNEYIKSATPGFLNYQQLEQDIKTYARQAVIANNYSAADETNLHKILGLINNLVNGPTGGLENGETNVNVYDLLKRCWLLAQRDAHNYGDHSRLMEVLMALDGNIADSGGCMPGVVARLYPLYVRFVRSDLEKQLTPMEVITGIFVEAGDKIARKQGHKIRGF